MMLVDNALNSALYNVSKRNKGVVILLDSVFSVSGRTRTYQKGQAGEKKFTHVDVHESDICGRERKKKLFLALFIKSVSRGGQFFRSTHA
ncbi:hypothetical protein ATANTOWER_012619 [Ataeniobius toweri]|uniref:Uncharacterized protein n=1 Tax=Ataeniobius toweri TaxID=208326 RepID=A0ABU7AZ08_9TELE|nr:hypothetical protein [Ataeniobius toweri]